jgi:hypothetical protein
MFFGRAGIGAKFVVTKMMQQYRYDDDFRTI